MRAARARHDGSRRNPWNEIECGSYYARSLSSYALLNAYIGLSFDQRAGEIGFRPARSGDGCYFWSAGRGWGEIEFSGLTATIRVKGGELLISRLGLPTLPGHATIDGNAREARRRHRVARRLAKAGAGDELVVGVDALGAT